MAEVETYLRDEVESERMRKVMSLMCAESEAVVYN